jgi:hypothetical protein
VIVRVACQTNSIASHHRVSSLAVLMHVCIHEDLADVRTKMRQNDARSARMFLEKLGHVVHLCLRVFACVPSVRGMRKQMYIERGSRLIERGSRFTGLNQSLD